MYDVIIIGAGFSGLYQLYLLKKNLNLNCHLFEKAPELGGTWYWNKYPGARCDTESKAYCYFFDQKIYNKWEWSERYPSQPEIQKYLKFVAKEFNLFENISFSSEVSKMRFNDETNTWKISLSNGKIYNSKFVVAATGCLSKPNQPTIKNLNNFKGQVFHTALWPSYKVNFKSQNVVVFGTGSSGIQIIPEIAKECKSLTVLQRTANFSIPAKNFRLDKYQNSKFKNNFDQIKSISFNNRHGHPWEHSKTPIDESNLNFDVFTTRPDTLFGMTFAVISPEHDLMNEILSISSNSKEINKYIDKAKSKSEFERMSITKEKTGVDTGLKVLNPVNNKSVPLWVADYVLINYGTGAIMAVPGHDERDYEFAKKYDLEIIQVIIDKDHSIDILEKPYIENGF